MSIAPQSPVPHSLPRSDQPAASAPGGVFSAALLWLSGGGVASLVVGWLAFSVLQAIQQSGLVPAVLPSLAVGLALGAALVALARQLNLTLHRWALAAAVLWGLSAVLVQDVCGWRYYCRQFEELRSANPLAHLAAQASDELKPPPFWEYLPARIHRDPFWWYQDALLTAGVTALVVGREIRRHRRGVAPTAVVDPTS